MFFPACYLRSCHSIAVVRTHLKVSPQKSPSQFCCAKEEQSRGFLEGTFKPTLLLNCMTAIKQQDRRQRASFLYLLFEGDNPALGRFQITPSDGFQNLTPFDMWHLVKNGYGRVFGHFQDLLAKQNQFLPELPSRDGCFEDFT